MLNQGFLAQVEERMAAVVRYSFAVIPVHSLALYFCHFFYLFRYALLDVITLTPTTTSLSSILLPRKSQILPSAVSIAL